METWWCEKSPKSVACERVKIHGLPRTERKAAMEKLHSVHHASAVMKTADHADIKKMHEAWCEINPKHATCDAWANHRSKIHQEI
jgi:hypothetical protein